MVGAAVDGIGNWRHRPITEVRTLERHPLHHIAVILLYQPEHFLANELHVIRTEAPEIQTQSTKALLSASTLFGWSEEDTLLGPNVTAGWMPCNENVKR